MYNSIYAWFYASPGIHEYCSHKQTNKYVAVYIPISSQFVSYLNALFNNKTDKRVQPVKGTDSYPHMPILRPVVTRPTFGFWGAKFPKMGDSLPRSSKICRAKFDAGSFILAEEIRNHKNKKQTKLQTVNNISTPCLSACVDKKQQNSPTSTMNTHRDRATCR